MVVKDILKDGNDYLDVIGNIKLNYRKVNMGDRYCYYTIDDNHKIPVIFYRIDLNTPDLNINFNFLGKVTGSKIPKQYQIVNYDVVYDAIKENRTSILGSLLSGTD